MPNLDFLDARHEVHTKNDTAWAREEKRLYGGDAVLDELVQFINENDGKYQKRRNEASWIGFPKTHASILAGHIVSALSVPNYGGLGDVRKREDRQGQPTLAELFHYNVDGVGADGSQLHAWLTGVLQRACATGHRWALVEMPRRVGDGPITQQEVIQGQRPYWVEYSPRAVTYWEYTAGRLDWAVVKTRVGASGIQNGVWQAAPTTDGYYLFVRTGYTGLGPEYVAGGWWLFDADKRLTSRGDWSKTRGEIPLVRLTAESSVGTRDWPAVSRSLTMELGQIAVSLMNRISERNYDASDAAKSVKYILGGDKDGHNLVVDMHSDGAVIITVPAVVDPQSGQVRIPTIYDSSSGAVAADVFTTIINSTIAEAHEIMVRQLTSTEDSSGRSKEVGFGEATSPLLASLAANTETFLNTLLYFTELRAGVTTPSAFVTLPREFEIAPVKEKIDRTIARMKEVGASSPTLVAKLIQDAAVDDGTWPKADGDSNKAKAELVESLTLTRREQQSTIFDTLAKSGSRTGAAKIAGFTPAEQKALDDVEEPAEGGQDNNGNGTQPPTNGAGRGVPALTQ
jgi:hypothetical protein